MARTSSAIILCRISSKPSVSCLQRQRIRNSIRQRSITTTSVQRSSLSEINTSRRAQAYAPDPSLQPRTKNEVQSSRLNPTADDYSRSIFIDKCLVTVHAGSGGNGCVAFFRDAHVSDGPPNGGDGGSGGNVWIQAVPNQTSLHKIARRGTVKAGRGIGGQGKSQGGRKGEDVCIQVPVGTVVREVGRSDPVAEEEERLKEIRGMGSIEETGLNIEGDDGESGIRGERGPSRSRWILYPGATPSEARMVQSNLPSYPKPRRSHLAVLQPPSPIKLDLDKAMDQPMLLAAGGVGGLGNPHFASRSDPKPKFATKGELGVRIQLELELKLLADVGLVGLPNAGKSTLLRAISNSRTRVGDWAFTTLEPTIGTVVLDDHTGPRPAIVASQMNKDAEQQPRTSFTVADIPGLIEDAHLDKGLGLGFLRHIERARILAFVVDLSAGDAVKALQNLWKEVGEYEELRNREVNEASELRFGTDDRVVEWSSFVNPGTVSDPPSDSGDQMMVFPPKQAQKRHTPSAFSGSSSRLDPLHFQPISAKPWFVIATKADREFIIGNTEPADGDPTVSSSSVEPASQNERVAAVAVDASNSANSLTTEQNFLKLHQYLQTLTSDSRSSSLGGVSASTSNVPHPSGHKNAWRENLAAIPVCAMKGEGMDNVIKWMVGLLDR